MEYAPAQRSASQVACHAASDERRRRALSAIGCVKRRRIRDLARRHDAHLVSAYGTTSARVSVRRPRL